VEGDAPGNSFILTPSPKTVTRLLRETIRFCASDSGADYLTTEERFHAVSGALAHLYHNTTFRSILHVKAEELVDLTREFLGDPESEKFYKPDRQVKIASEADRLKKVLDQIREQEMITHEAIIFYISIVDSLRQRYLADGYNPEGICNPDSYALALLIAANFDAYDKTINEK